MLLAGVIVAGVHSTASAQSVVYVTGAGFADIRTFSQSDISLYPGIDTGLGGTAAGGGVRVGTFLHPRWSLELGVDAAGKTERATPFAIILADTVPSRIPQAKDSVRFMAVNTVVGYHPVPRGRIRPGFRIGFSFVRASYKTQYPNYYVPAAQASSTLESSIASRIPTIYPPPVVPTQTVTSSDLSGSLILGFETALDFGRHVAIVPEIRAQTLSSNRAGDGVLIRPGVGVRWSF
jgi:hypothetical protein